MRIHHGRSDERNPSNGQGWEFRSDRDVHPRPDGAQLSFDGQRGRTRHSSRPVPGFGCSRKREKLKKLAGESYGGKSDWDIVADSCGLFETGWRRPKILI